MPLVGMCGCEACTLDAVAGICSLARVTSALGQQSPAHMNSSHFIPRSLPVAESILLTVPSYFNSGPA